MKAPSLALASLGLIFKITVESYKTLIQNFGSMSDIMFPTFAIKQNQKSLTWPRNCLLVTCPVSFLASENVYKNS